MRARQGVEPQGQHNQIRWLVELRASLNQERARPLGIRQAKFGADETQAGNLTLAIAQNGNGNRLEYKPGAFLAGVFILVAAAGHIRFVTPTDAHGLLSAVTNGGAQAVHGSVAPPHDHYALAGDFDGGEVQRHGGGFLQDERQGLDDALQVSARHCQWPGFAGVEPKEEGVELAAQLSEARRFVKLDTQAEDNPAFLEKLNAALEDGPLDFESRGAVHQQSAWHEGGIEDSYGVAAPGQFIRTRQAARAGANHGDAPAVGRGGAGVGLPVGEGIFGEESLDGADGDRFGDAVENAGAFAETVGGADARADFRHVGDGAEHSSGLKESAFGSQEHPLGDGIAERATADTARVGALDAAAGLLAGGGLVVEAVDF